MSEPRSASFYWSRGEEMPPDPEPASGDVEAARAAIWTANGVNEMIDALDAFEAAIRAAALDEARAAVLSRETIHQYWDHDDTVLLSQPDVLAAIDALRETRG